MTRRMLINAQRPEELRIAVVNDDTLENYQVQVAERGLTRGNIYRGVIASIQPSLNAAFIDYGAERHGFLAIQDVVPEAYYRTPEGKGRPKIEEVLDRGKPIVVQVTREPEGQKGAALTTNLSLAGRYLVLTPFDDTRGISRKVEDEDTRKKLRQIVGKLKIPAGCGVIVRTNALDQNKTALNRDFSALSRLWKRIQTEAREGGRRKQQAKLLYSDQDIVVQALRDYLDSSIQEVLVDDDAVNAKAEKYMKAFMPRSKTQLIRYQERAPLFSGYKLERQIDRIYDRIVELQSGGSIVIDRTEALTAIDVNSGRSTRAGSQEETALHTNVEAAAEVARQLRLRDIGGLLVVDFIDMRSIRNQKKVEKALRDAMKPDKARTAVSRISRNGLLEINRQRIHQALDMRTHRSCPTCDGTGRIASPEMVGLNLLRRIEARAASGPLKKVRIALHPELADAFQNDRRLQIADIEREFELQVEVIAASHLHRHEQEVEWMQRDAPSVDQRPKVERQPRVTSTEVTEAPTKKPRRRRRRSRRGGSDEAPAVEASTEESAATAAEEAAPRGSRRRGRRKEPAQKDAAPAPTDAASADSEAAPKPARRSRRKGVQPAPPSDSVENLEENDSQIAVLGLGGEDGAEPANRGRRRRSRRRTAKPAASDEPAAPAAEPTDLPPGLEEPADSQIAILGYAKPGEDPLTNGKPAAAKPRRRRGSRRGGGGKANGNLSAGGNSDAPPPRRRPRRRRRPPSGGGTSPSSGAPGNTD
ncbi:MAG: Rne/Rng family ribonuclease [Acidobacteriota bacterium]